VSVASRFDSALVLSAGGLWAAWQAGAWSVLRDRFRADGIVGASAGAWNGWAIAGGATPEELASQWMEESIGRVMQFGLHRAGFLRGEPLVASARRLFDRYQPRMPFALTIVEVPSMRPRVVCDGEITWKHLAASCAIPFGFPPVEIDGRWYVDGGFRAGLPLWAAEELGARRVLALNVLNTPGFRVLHKVLWGRGASASLDVTLVEPSYRLGSLHDAVVWNPRNIGSWIEAGRRDASSVKM
jgi:NTE family protein